MGNAMSALSREEREEMRQRVKFEEAGKAIVSREDLLALISSIDAVERIDSTLTNWIDRGALDRLRAVLVE